jgi:acetyl-CoA carboxylase carboxyl transferase subunit alpha
MSRPDTALNLFYLDFEQPIIELENKIEALRLLGQDGPLNLTDEIARLQGKCASLTQSVFAGLSAWDISRLARHPKRPYTLDYIQSIFTDFDEMHGDRRYGDDPAIVGGTARLNGLPVMVIGHQKGRETREKVKRNFGMPRPEGYRKALRLMETAERFKLPVLTFIDTPGAYPGIDAEERGQGEAIATNLAVMSRLLVPIISIVIGEGGSGGALGIGVCDRLLMLQYATYAVISPEGCASILWKNAEYAADAAEAMGITADRLKELGFVDEIVEEPMGGAHRNPDACAERVKDALARQLDALQADSAEALVEARYHRYTAMDNYL